MRVLIVTSGDLTPTLRLHQLAAGHDLCLAADGGLGHAQVLGITPDLLLGDLDSVRPQTLASYPGPRRTFPTSKDQTDLELALVEALVHQPWAITILGGLGKRFDHSLANLFLLADLAGRGIVARLDTGRQGALVLSETRPVLVLDAPAGAIVSLIPLTVEVTGITTWGLEYPLQDATLVRHQARGVSNVATAPAAQVRLVKGLLAVIVQYLPEETP
ncbi:MAG: thiamine diphosphokinase [Deinococcus sp.]|nr:thiamine diphosphokinase [Deinococcus sp.]